MINPWFLAAGLMALVGALEELGKPENKPKALPKPKQEPKPGAPVTVNVNQPSVQSKGDKPKPEAKPKPSGEVPDEPFGDG